MILIDKLPYLIDRLHTPTGSLAKGGVLEVEPTELMLDLGDQLFARTRLGKEEHSVGVYQAFIEGSMPLAEQYVEELERVTNSAIRQYLGNYQVDVVYEHLSVFGEDVHRNSQLWHHDSVGRRVKIFINPYDTNPAPTLVEVGTVGRKYRQAFWDKAQRASYTPTGDIMEVRTVRNKVSVFDTNAIHCGANGEPNSFRHLLMIEMSHPLKTFTRGKVGRRNFL